MWSTLWPQRRRSRTRNTALSAGKNDHVLPFMQHSNSAVTAMFLGSLASSTITSHLIAITAATFPWTVSIEAAAELADELDALTAEEKGTAQEQFPDLVKKTPKTIVAETRQEIDEEGWSRSLRRYESILIDVVSEAVKKSVFGG